MSRKLSLEIITDSSVQRVISSGQKTLVWIATQAVEHAAGFDEVIATVDNEEVKLIARAGLPSAFAANMSNFTTFTGAQIAERLVRDAEELRRTIDIATQVYEEENASEQEKLAAEQKAAEAAELARQKKESDEKEAADRERSEARAVRDAADKAEAAKIAAEQKAAAERVAAEKAAADVEAAEADAKNAEGDVVNVEDDGRLTQAGLDSMPIKASGLPHGIINNLLAGRIETVGNLILLAEHEDGDLSVIKGIGPESSEKIMARIIELKSQVAASESE